MKPSRYKVIFDTDIEVEILAFCKKEAVILAQAEQIKKGNRYTVFSVEKIRE
jgi:hypothetical protein